MGVWTKNGKILVGNNGHPIDCDQCPCGGLTCDEAVDREVASMLAERDEQGRPIWSLYGTYSPDFSCAAWHYDETYGEWILDRTASGSLLVALQVGTTVTDTTNCLPSFLLYAKLLYSASQGLWHTVGCECVVQDHQCTRRKASLRDYSIAGVLPPWQLPEGTPAASYEPYMACQPDPCQVLKLKMTTAHYWHGGEWFGEGYYDWLLAPHGGWVPENINYWPFQMAIKWQEDVSESVSSSFQPTQYLTYLACDCSGIATHTIHEKEAVLEYAGACTIQEPCVDLLLLHNQAMFNGWIWHGEGALVHKATMYHNGEIVHIGDWYALRDQKWTYSYDGYSEEYNYNLCLCAAETDDAYYIVNCDCYTSGQPTYKRKYDVDDYYLYLDMDGVCNCQVSHEDSRPDRELLLAYPDVFGVVDMCFGNHAKYDYSYSYSYEDDWGETVSGSDSGCHTCGVIEEPTSGVHMRTMYIDYRTINVILPAFWMDGTEKLCLRVLYAPHSRAVPTRSSGWNTTYYYWAEPWTRSPFTSRPWGIYDTVSFRGDYWTPFTNDPDFRYEYSFPSTEFTGYAHYWSHAGWESDQWVNGCQKSGGCDYYNREDAEDAAGCSASVPTPCIGVGGDNGHSWALAPLLTPDFSVADHPCQISSQTIHGEYMDITKYCIDAYRWITIGADVGTYDGNCYWMLYHVQYVKTNKGYIIKGLGDYQKTYTLLGAKNYPQYTACWGQDPEEQVGWNDTILPDISDEDMHFCSNFEWELPDGSDSESSTSN